MLFLVSSHKIKAKLCYSELKFKTRAEGESTLQQNFKVNNIEQNVLVSYIDYKIPHSGHANTG